jgi:hypothetical protein
MVDSDVEIDELQGEAKECLMTPLGTAQSARLTDRMLYVVPEELLKAGSFDNLALTRFRFLPRNGLIGCEKRTVQTSIIRLSQLPDDWCVTAHRPIKRAGKAYCRVGRPEAEDERRGKADVIRYPCEFRTPIRITAKADTLFVRASGIWHIRTYLSVANR